MAKELEQIDVAAANAAKLKALQATMDKIEKDFGKGAIMKLGDRPEGDVSVIPSGSIALDHALGIGGYPRGRVIEIFGPESSGKTTLAIHAIAEAQKAGGFAAMRRPRRPAALRPSSTRNTPLTAPTRRISEWTWTPSSYPSPTTGNRLLK